MERETKRIILVGPGGSGKDYLAKRLLNAGFVKDVSLTTREPRFGEVEGVDYNYISEEEFLSLIEEGKFEEYTIFDGNYYGTLEESWLTSNVFIRTPDGVEVISPVDRQEAVVVFFDIPEHIRAERLSLRQDEFGNFISTGKVMERLSTDRKKFAGFINYDYRINDQNFDPDVWVETLKHSIKIEEDEKSN